jgi:type II secretion system protein E
MFGTTVEATWQGVEPPSALPALRDIETAPVELTAEFLEGYGVLPMRIEGDRLLTATWLERVDYYAIDELHLLFGVPPALLTYPEEEVRRAIQRLYGAGSATAEGVLAGLGVETADHAAELAIDDLVSLANEAPVVKLVNLLLLEALEARASDVHLESYTTGLKVRYRIDGVLQAAPSPSGNLAQAVISRLKIMADLDIAERRLPQDGRIRLKLQDRSVDVRVSTLPALHGESVVLRLLDKALGRISLDDLGMAADTLRRFRSIVRKPHGIVLATGPTGSGKTTTLYAAIDHIRTGTEKILTVEDPVEYELEGVPQVAVNERVGLTFASALRSLLRQDPDIMLVGEIRDPETAEIATHAALTGHLVLSTLHTNDAPSALTRLLDLDVPAYLVASTVEGVLAQRLVRRVCPDCAEPRPAAPDVLAAFGSEARDLETINVGRGCDACRGTGFRGRTGIYELFAMDDEIRAEVQAQRGTRHVRALAIERGMMTLRQDGLRLVREGLTTPEEVLRITTE